MSTIRKCLIGVAVVALLTLWASSTMALVVMWNTDIHQNKFGYPNDPIPNNFANDFHIWGILESGLPDGSNPPILNQQINFQVTGPGGPPVVNGIQFQTFTSQIGNPVNRPLPPNSPWPPALPPQPPFYYFDANWSNPTANIPYCTWMHFGLSFDETCHNIGYWLQGVWTKNGVDPTQQPIYGFEVRDGILAAERQRITIQNASGVETVPLGMDLMVLAPAEVNTFPLQNLNTSFFDNHPEWNSRWVHVPTGMLPSHLVGDGGVNSFFDVYLDQLGLVIPPGGGLMAREYSSYQGGSTDYFWNYELHGAHMPEPGTLVMLTIAGIAMLLTFRRWRRSM
jgi:hypothetical protein